MRAVWALVGVVGLAGCEPSPEVQQLQAACQAGDMGACYASASLEQDRRARMSEAMRGMTLAGQPGFTCTHFGMTTTCR